jgi:thioredoxin 1
MSENIIQLDQASFKREIEEFDGVALIDFWAPWCGPCRAIGPIIEELAREYQGKVKVAKVNVDDNNDLAMQFSIRSIPTILLFSKGAVKESIVGAVPKTKLAQALNRLVG